MTRLADVIAKTIEDLMDETDTLDLHAAVKAVRGKLDDAELELLVQSAIGRRISRASLRYARALELAEPAQGCFLYFPSLRAVHIVDVAGRPHAVRTARMTRDQFEQAMTVRRDQIAHDVAYLQVLEGAWAQVRVLWVAHPKATFGEVCALLSTTARQAAE